MNKMYKILLMCLIVSMLTFSVCKAQTDGLDVSSQMTNMPTAKANTIIDSKINTETPGLLTPKGDIIKEKGQPEQEETYNDNLTGARINPKTSFNVIETMFGGSLKQYGYNLLGGNASLSLAGSISPNYKLTKGDKIIVYLWGDTLTLLNMTGNKTFEPIMRITIDETGSLFVPNIGLIKAEGLTIAQIERSLSSVISGMYSGINLRAMLDDPKGFPIFVIGNAGSPGVIYVTSSCSILDAINLSGGISKIGSLRDITYINGSNKAKTSIDLYDFFMKGQLKDIKLKKGDTILVKPIGKVVGIASGVKYPAIYEFKNNETLYDIINIANGLLPSINTDHIQVESYDKETKQKSIRDLSLSELKSIKPSDGDIVSFRSFYNQAENVVKIQGNIKRSGSFQYMPGMKLSDILKSRNDLLNNTFIDQAFIVRLEGLEKRTITIPFSLEDFFSGKVDPSLQPLDSIFITSGSQMASVLIEGEVNNPGPIPLRSGMTLKSMLPLISLKDNINNVVIEAQTKSGLKTVYLHLLLTKNDPASNLALSAGDTLLFRPITNKELLKAVSVIGYVNNPGVFKVRPGTRITDVIQEAGGLLDEAYLKGMVFLRPGVAALQQEALNEYIIKLKEEIAQKEESMIAILDEMQKANLMEEVKKQQEMLARVQEKFSKNYGRIIIDIKGNDLSSLSISDNDNLEIREGDEIIIPMKSNHIIVMGEVQNSSALIFVPKKNIKYYLDKVGGFTETAKKNRTMILKPDGSSERIKSMGQLVADPGSIIVVPKKYVDKINVGIKTQTITSIINSAFQVGSTVFMLMNIRK